MPKTDPIIEISTSSGMLRVNVHPARSWPLIVLEAGMLTAFAVLTYEYWGKISHLFRALLAVVIALSPIELVLQWSEVETIEIDSDKITLCRDIRGWERRREYRIKECRELEWMEGSEDRPQRLQFKTGWKSITFGRNLTETQGIQVLTALQQVLPDVAQQLCSYPEGKKHFITLGLS